MSGNTSTSIYGPSLALLTDLYQLTMAYSYWKSGTHNKESVFHLFFRKPPFNSGLAIACGLHLTIDFLKKFRIDETDVSYLSTLLGADGKPLFSAEFLDYLSKLRFSCQLDCVPEGTIVFPQEPLLRIQGPIVECQLLETALLNIWNFQTLIASKANRIRQAAGESRVVEFGCRRAQGIDGALTASWAAHIGGCDSTSNVLAGKLFGIPVTGTHAHSWVMCFDDELTAFQTYARVMPNNSVFLVDTYDTLNGVKHAIEVGKILESRGHKLQGIRLDSGDLSYLSIEARKMLDQSGFTDTLILASNDLDESIIASLKAQGAAIDVWGVGTKLVTAFDQPALGGVYKLAATRDPGSAWKYTIKLSEQATKISTPGIQQIRRFFKDGRYIADAIFDTNSRNSPSFIVVDPLDTTRRKIIPAEMEYSDLLVPIFRDGKQVYIPPGRQEIKSYVNCQLAKFHPTIRRLLNPHEYPVGLESGLQSLRTELILKSRAINHCLISEPFCREPT
jgi:nicotinate phosphoribosyltransferase